MDKLLKGGKVLDDNNLWLICVGKLRGYKYINGGSLTVNNHSLGWGG